MHDRVSGHAGRVRSLDRFLTYARSKPGVCFARNEVVPSGWLFRTLRGS